MVAPPGQAEPGGQNVQTLFLVVVHVVVSYVPAKQVVQELQVLLFPRENVEAAIHEVMLVPPGQADPGGQNVQTLFWVVVQACVS
jgi:hypothetical protein